MFPLSRPRYAPHLPPVLGGMNRAGSVGKTTLGYNLCVQAAMRGYRPLLVDGDLQSDASYWSGWDGDNVPDGAMTVHDVMLGAAKLSDATVPGQTRVAADDSGEEPFQTIEGLHLVRGDRKMSQADSELTQDPAGVFWLLRALKREIEEDQYDFIWIDCPASLGRLSVSLLLAITEVMVSMLPTKKEMRGAIQLTAEINRIRDEYEDFDATPQASFYIINQAKKHASQGSFYLEKQDEVGETFGARLLPSVPSAVIVPEAYDAQEPLAIWKPDAPIVGKLDGILDTLGFPAR